jgi:hypothetical protein
VSVAVTGSASLMGREMISDLEEMMHNHLKQFESSTRTKPDKILFYRVRLTTRVGSVAHTIGRRQ